ncbi:MAG TPA: hypothetical protein VGR35_05555 [Tepidisphaeraceae bacterium]|nr:hypothetical protein [Tepidisphaeraceae bacterium]
MDEIDPRPPSAAFDAYFCPDCELGVVGVEGEPHLLHCERCGKYFAVPMDERTAEQEDETSRESELSGLRIRQLAGARRAAYRSRSYCVIGALVCVVGVVQLTWMSVRLIRATGFGWQHIAYALIALLAAWGAIYFFRKAVELDREAKQSSLPAPAAEPDFTPLSDGSQRWKSLEDVR